jgi:hypothetical protein
LNKLERDDTMREMAILEWWKAIINVLLAYFPKTVDLQTIYLDVRQHRTLTDNDLKITYRRPNYEHTVRRTLTNLVKERSVDRVKRATYRLVM